MSEPREFTVDEIRDQFLSHVAYMVRYWETLPEIDRATGRCHTTRDRLEGVAFSILAALDGTSMALPAFVIAPNPHPEDKQFHIDEGTNYYPEAPEIASDIGGGLHEVIHKYLSKL